MSQTTLIMTTTYTPVIHSDPNYRQGTCTFTTAFDLPLVTGSYYYKVVVYPGGTEKQFGPLDIERPFEPTIVCTPSPYVQENTNINCNCKTTNVGKPGGYLTWSRESNGKVNIINNGSYSGTNLTMNPQVLNASDHNTTVLQCTVEWMNTAIKGGFYIANVSYIDQSVIKVNSLPNLSVAEIQPVTFNCSADGRPVPSMSLINKGNGILTRRDTSPLTHTIPAARCEDTSTYICLASNGMGKDTTSAANLYVNCKPRVRSGATPPVLFQLEVRQNQASSSQFDVIAYPTPNKFMFTFIGFKLTENINSSNLQGMIMNATCRERQELYISNCIITAFNNNSDGGFYVVMVANAHGSEQFTFEITVNDAVSDGMPESDCAMLSQGIGIGIGVTLAFILIMFGVLTLYLWRRKWKLPCVDKPEDAASSNPALVTSSRMKDEGIALDSTDKYSTSYDVLRINEIGIAAPYSDLGNYGDVRGINSGKKHCTDNISKVHNDNHVYDNTAV